MNKKGFTLVELLAVIVIMAILITIAVPGIMRIMNSLKTQSLCSKIEIIESAALEYAGDYYSNKKNTNASKVILDNVSLADLVNMGYLSKDDDDCTLYSATSPCVINPEDSSVLDYNVVQIWSTNNRLYASYLYTEEQKNNKICGADATYNIQGSYSTNASVQKTITVNTQLDFYKKRPSTSTYSWSDYGNILITRPDDIRGDYRISKVIINYTLSSGTVIEISGSSIGTQKYYSSGTHTFSISNKETSGFLSISFRGAVNGYDDKENSYVKITSVNVTWTKIT